MFHGEHPVGTKRVPTHVVNSNVFWRATYLPQWESFSRTNILMNRITTTKDIVLQNLCLTPWFPSIAFPAAGSAMEPWKQGCHFDAGGALRQIWWREIQSRGYQLWDLGLGHSIQREQLGGSEESHIFRICLSEARSFAWLVWASWLLEKNHSTDCEQHHFKR